MEDEHPFPGRVEVLFRHLPYFRLHQDGHFRIVRPPVPCLRPLVRYPPAPVVRAREDVLGVHPEQPEAEDEEVLCERFPPVLPGPVRRKVYEPLHLRQRDGPFPCGGCPGEADFPERGRRYPDDAQVFIVVLLLRPAVHGVCDCDIGGDGLVGKGIPFHPPHPILDEAVRYLRYGNGLPPGKTRDAVGGVPVKPCRPFPPLLHELGDLPPAVPDEVEVEISLHVAVVRDVADYLVNVHRIRPEAEPVAQLPVFPDDGVREVDVPFVLYPEGTGQVVLRRIERGCDVTLPALVRHPDFDVVCAVRLFLVPVHFSLESCHAFDFFVEHLWNIALQI